MIFRKLIGLGFLAMMLFVFLGAFGSMRQSRTNMAYMEGYIAGQQAVAGEDGTVNGNAATASTMPPYSTNTHYRGHGGFFPGMGLLLCLLPFMFLGFMSMMFGCKRRHWQHGPGGPGHWHQHSPWKGNAKPVWEDENFENEPPKEA